MTTNYTFRTTKTATGFRAEVNEMTSFKNGRGEWMQTFCTVKRARFQTRASATGYAKKWTLYFRQVARRAAAA